MTPERFAALVHVLRLSDGTSLTSERLAALPYSDLSEMAQPVCRVRPSAADAPDLWGAVDTAIVGFDVAGELALHPLIRSELHDGLPVRSDLAALPLVLLFDTEDADR